MSGFRRWVFDTNALVSHLLFPNSVPARALQKALETGDLLVSDATLQELVEVLARPKFDRYLEADERIRFLELLGNVAIRVEIVHQIELCRDPKGNRFLSLAINGQADAIITGDSDLLELHPFMGIPIVTPVVFLTSI